MRSPHRFVPILFRRRNLTRHFSKFALLIVLGICHQPMLAQSHPSGAATMDVGIARIDISPDGPIRLAGYGARTKRESEGILQPLSAKAMAFGNDAQKPSIFITVDLVGIPGYITTKLADKLSEKTGIDPAQIVICATHTHGGPEVGNLMNILQYRGDTFSDSLLATDQLVHISQYIEQLAGKLEQVALAALKDRHPALVSWGQGQAFFAKNRRTEDGPVDTALPLLRVTDPAGKLRAVLLNYACHGTTLEGNVNKVHGDWIGEAQKLIEANHPGAMALIAIGCGADSNPNPRGKMEHISLHAQEIAKNVDRLLGSSLQPLTVPPVGRMEWVKLPYNHIPDVSELITQTQDKSVKGYYARLALDRIARGHAIPSELSYPIQIWTFGNDLAMINLAGEVVVDYSIRLKNELGAEKLWINAYANDVPCYIASRRIIGERGYEAETSMYFYDKPGPFAVEVEDIIVDAVHKTLPVSYTLERDTVNHPEIVRAAKDGSLHLHAAVAQAIGPEIKYMREWKAFGWFTEADKVAWNVELKDAGRYDVYMDWAVSDQESGKQFVMEGGDRKLSGKVDKTGSWFTYRKEKIGSIRLPAGSHQVVFRPAKPSEKGALLDMREITLVPVK